MYFTTHFVAFAVSAATAVEVPKTPKGLEPCTEPLVLEGKLSAAQGETVRYLVDIDDVSVGTIDFQIAQHGTLDGAVVTEYRSRFELDALVSTFVPVHGQAAAVVGDGQAFPKRAMNRFTLGNDQIEEEVVYGAQGMQLSAERSKQGKTKKQERQFAIPAIDFVTGFYAVRNLAITQKRCTVMYGNGRAYTVWLEPAGKEKVKTPVGYRMADRYNVRYSSEKGKRVVEGAMWLGEAPMKVPFRAELRGKHKIAAQIHLYQVGRE